MTMTWQSADNKLNGDLRNPATPHLWLHTGNPGSAGTANVAELSGSDIVRKPITFGDAPANHAVNDERYVKNTAEVAWSGAEIDPGEAITHFSIWSGLSEGTPLHISTITDGPKTTGSDGVTVSIGDIEVAISVFIKEA